MNELTSCNGKAAEKAPWSTRLRTPTSPFFSRPKGVVQRISNTIRLLWAREKKFVMSSLPRNLREQNLLDRNACIACTKMNMEEYNITAARIWLIVSIQNWVLRDIVVWLFVDVWMDGRWNGVLYVAQHLLCSVVREDAFVQVMHLRP